MAEGIRSATALPVQIKWPNDIVTAGSFRARRKIAGILAEASSGPSGVDRVVLGIGINLRSAAYPPEIADRATAIEVELGRPVDAGLVLAQVLNIGGQGVLTPAQGASIEWDAQGRSKRGVTAGLAEDGALLARTDEGIERILAGEIRWA